ncbi:DUF2442 domain-containing protein [Gelria sp. Kuro-4]|uniref:DUF2442 domain-containing protein n=1 Tax=Gelria sp. Kuro-4 TaxID=2796927 RepID=UPI001BF15DFE|nr:DUF2442 domain-containing protein [Gelria sp. Kuro-4]BCV24016.1 hypothetical protein kuro4_07890 [Gelria sp. Kuro-4]
MSTSVTKSKPVLVISLWFTEDKLCVFLDDGREVAVPLEWFPRLRDASPAERENWRLIGGGIGINWPVLDEDIAVESLLQPETWCLVPARD